MISEIFIPNKNKKHAVSLVEIIVEIKNYPPFPCHSHSREKMGNKTIKLKNLQNANSNTKGLIMYLSIVVIIHCLPAIHIESNTLVLTNYKKETIDPV